MSVNQSSTMVGVFRDKALADQAMDALLDAGFASDQIRYAGPGSSGSIIEDIKNLFAGPSHNNGSIVDDLTDMGVPDEVAEYYSNEYNSGNTVVAVQAPGREQAAADILNGFNAYNYDTYNATSSSTGTSYGQQTSNDPYADDDAGAIDAQDNTAPTEQQPVVTNHYEHDAQPYADTEANGQVAQDISDMPTQIIGRDTIIDGQQYSTFDDTTDQAQADTDTANTDSYTPITDQEIIQEPQNTVMPEQTEVDTDTADDDTYTPVTDQQIIQEPQQTVTPDQTVTDTDTDANDEYIPVTDRQIIQESQQPVDTQAAEVPAVEDHTESNEPIDQDTQSKIAEPTPDQAPTYEEDHATQPNLASTHQTAIDEEEDRNTQPDLTPIDQAFTDQDETSYDTQPDLAPVDQVNDEQPQNGQYEVTSSASDRTYEATNDDQVASTPVSDETPTDPTATNDPAGTSAQAEPVAKNRNTELEDLQAQIQAHQQHLQDLQTQLQAAKEREVQLRQAKEERESKLRESRQQLQDLQAQLQATMAELQETHNRISEYE